MGSNSSGTPGVPNRGRYGEDVRSQGGREPSDSTSFRNVSRSRGHVSQDWKGWQAGCPRQRPRGGNSKCGLWWRDRGGRVMQGFGCPVQGLCWAPRVLGSHGRTLSRGRAGQLWGPVGMDWRLGDQEGGCSEGPWGEDEVGAWAMGTERRGHGRVSQSLGRKDRDGDFTSCGDEVMVKRQSSPPTSPPLISATHSSGPPFPNPHLQSIKQV